MSGLALRFLGAARRRIDRWRGAILVRGIRNPLRVGDVVVSDTVPGVVLGDGSVRLEDGRTIAFDSATIELRPGDRVLAKRLV